MILIAAGVVALALLPGPFFPPGVRVSNDPRRAFLELVWRVAPFALAAVLLYAQVAGDEIDAVNGGRLMKLLLLGAAVVVVAATAEVNALLAPVVITYLIAFNLTDPLVRERTFFGVIEVVDTGDSHKEFSGTTLHGLQATDQRKTEPTTYYAKVGPLGAIFDDLRHRTVDPSIGVVGLGAGTIAAYAQSGDHITFFEIDQAVIDIASNPAYFTYLSDAPAVPRIVAGDGRLSLNGEPAASFDLLVLDAFTSDVVPAHLLTREAMQVYARTLRPGGLLAFHVSSRFYDLAVAVGATALSNGLAVAGLHVVPSQAEADRIGASISTWLVVGLASDIARYTALGWTPAPPIGPVLTDDYSDLTRLLILGGR